MTAPLLIAGVLLALGGLALAYRRWGWAGVAGGVVALLGLLAAVLRRRPPPPPPPPGDGPSRATRTAGDQMHRVAREERAKIADVADDPDELAREMGRQR